MSQISAFGVDHEIISKRGGRLAGLFGRGAKAANKHQKIPNDKKIQQLKDKFFQLQ